MKQFWLQAVIIIAAGLITGLAFAMSSNLPRDVKLVDKTNEPVVPKQPSNHNPQPTGATGPSGSTGPTAGTSATPSAPTGQAPEADADLISVAAAKALFDSHNAVFIDARPKAEFLQSHVVGAMQLEKGDLDGAPPAKVLNYLPGMEIVVYCHGELCTDSANVVKRLLALNKGIGPMHIIKDGFPGWQNAGHPVEPGAEVGFE